MKKTYSFLLLFFFIASCNGQDTTKTVGISNTSDPSSDIVSAALKDKKGNIWFAASGRGVYRYDGKSFVNFTQKDGLSSNDVSCIYEDNTGKLWFGTNVGVCHYDGKTFTIFPIFDSSNGNSNFQIPKHIVSILQDRTGNFWFVTLHSGVYRYDGKLFTNFLSHEVLVCILEDKAGNIWVGSWSHGGVYCYNGNSFTHFNGLSDDMIKCLLEDKEGNIWIGTRARGVDRYDGKTITNFSEQEGLCSNNVSCIFEDKNGHIWFGSDFGGSVNKRGDACSYNGKFFINVTAKEILTEKEGLPYCVMSIAEDNNGNIWFGSRGGKLLRYDGNYFTDFSEQLN